MPQSIEQLRSRYAELERLLSQPAELERAGALPARLKEFATVGKLLSLHDRLLAVRSELAAARALLDDPDADVRTLARSEIERLEAVARSLRQQLLVRLAVEKDDLERDVILEIRPGVGGEEAALFAADLFKMYRRYAEARGWEIKVLDIAGSDLGGCKEVAVRLSGDGVFPRLRFEAGTHRVQRVPVTESQGRVHTSAATVAVLPEAEEVEVSINPEDLEITAMHSRGPGGQSVNTASSAVRILHKPSGLMVRCDVERSQRQNRMLALRILRTKLLELERQRRQESERTLRRSQIGTGDRSERIRTYNFPQNRVSDHRLQGDDKNFPLDRVMQGDLDPIVERLSEQEAGGLLGGL